MGNQVQEGYKEKRAGLKDIQTKSIPKEDKAFKKTSPVTCTPNQYLSHNSFSMNNKNIHIENMGNTDLQRAFFLPATSLILYNRNYLRGN